MHRFFIGFLLIVSFFTCVSANADMRPVRLHVYAEDDSEEMQKVKMLLKDIVVSEVKSITENAKTEKEAYALLFRELAGIRKALSEEAERIGYTGEISVTVQNEFFPARLIQNTVFPEGEYPSVCVRLGKAEGKNWWCVLYPSFLGIDAHQTDEIEFYSGIRTFFQRLFG